MLRPVAEGDLDTLLAIRRVLEKARGVRRVGEELYELTPADLVG